MIKFDARQTLSRDILARLAAATGTSLDSLLRSINSEVTPPFSLSASATPNLIVNVGSNKVSNTENSARHSNSFINKQFPTFTSGTITFPAASGSTIVVSPTVVTAPTLTIAPGQFVLGLIECDSLGNISISLGAAGASEILAGVPGINKKALQIGMIVITNTAGVIDAITSAKIIQFAGAGGSGSASASGSGTGDDLSALMFKASFTDNIDDLPTDATSAIDYTTGKTNSALYNSAGELIRISYDASKTVTGTGTAMTLSATPSYTVAVGDILRVGAEAKRITVVTSQTSYTIESAFIANPTAAAATVSQAIYTKDIYNAAIDGASLFSIFGSTVSEILVRYDDTTTLNNIIPDFNTTPVVSFTASSNNTSFSAVSVRATNLTDKSSTLVLPTSSAGLFLRFFSNASSGSGSVNLLGYKCFLIKDAVSASANTTQQAYLFTNSAGTPVNASQPTVVGGKTRIVTTWTYPLGLNSGTTNGALSVYLNGQKTPRFVSSTLTPDASYTEVANNIIDLDRDYSLSSLSIEIKYDTSVVDATATSSTSITSLQNLSRDGFQAFVQETALTAVNGTPGLGQFRSSITGRATIPDLSNNLKVQMGVERIMTEQISQLQSEFGPNGEPVWAAVNDDRGLIRFVGNGWYNITDVNGSRPDINTGTTTEYVEITFFGTGLNVLTAAVSNVTAAQFAVSVDGATESTVVIGPANASGVMTGRNYSSNQPLNIASNLTLGIHTIKLRKSHTYAGNINVYGFETLNETTTLKANPGSAYIEGQKVTAANLTFPSYNSTFESGTLGTRGGRVLTYLKNDGTIAKAVTPVNAAQANNASSDHTNEEVARIYNWREFGAGRTDDFSRAVGLTLNLAFTLDDGITSLVGSNVNIGTGNFTYGPSYSANGSFTIFTFVGTGCDIIRADTSSSAGTDTFTITVDGALVNTISGTGSQTLRQQKIVSGLPYGTHTVKITRTSVPSTFDATAVSYIVYQPKKPTLPAGAIELADYNVMATYVANSTVGTANIGTGVIRKVAVRELTYVGTGWNAGLDPVNDVAGIRTETNVSGDYAEYTFFGTGVDFRFYGIVSNGTTAATITIDGSSNLAGFTTSSYGAASFTASTGVFSQAVTNAGAGISISGLTLGLHKIRVTNNSTSFLRIDSFDIITPIYSAKSNFSTLQNTKLVGSNAISDNRKTTAIKSSDVKKKSYAQAVGVVSGPTTTSTTPVPLADMECMITTGDGEVEVQFNATFVNNTIATVFGQIYVDGVPQGISTQQTIPSANYGISYPLFAIVPVSAGTHIVQIFWYVTGGTGTAYQGQRILTVKER